MSIPVSSTQRSMFRRFAEKKRRGSETEFDGELFERGALRPVTGDDEARFRVPPRHDRRGAEEVVDSLRRVEASRGRDDA